MTGTSSGVATQFIERYGENVETFHCLAHRIELAVNDALKKSYSHKSLAVIP
jgi:orotate phosphoribosyltransferase